MFISTLLILLLFYKIISTILTKKTDSVKCLVGKTAVLTGGNSGLGYGISLLLASRGCKVIIADRDNAEKSKDDIIKLTGNSNIYYEYVDLSSLKTVRAFAKKINESEKKIDILINNAGIGATSKKITEDGLNFIMQVNYFGSFLLTHLLLDSLNNGQDARILFASSLTVFIHQLKWNNLNSTDFDESNYNSSARQYANSKFCNLLAAQMFSRKLKTYGISAYSYDPIHVKTSIFKKVEDLTSGFSFWRIFIFFSHYLFSQEPLSAGETALHLALSDDPKKSSWTHYACCRKMVKPKLAKDKEFCQKFWMETEKLVNLQPEEKI